MVLCDSSKDGDKIEWRLTSPHTGVRDISIGIFELSAREQSGETVNLHRNHRSKQSAFGPRQTTIIEGEHMVERLTLSCRPKEASLSCLNSLGKTSLTSYGKQVDHQLELSCI